MRLRKMLNEFVLQQTRRLSAATGAQPNASQLKPPPSPHTPPAAAQSGPTPLPENHSVSVRYAFPESPAGASAQSVPLQRLGSTQTVTLTVKAAFIDTSHITKALRTLGIFLGCACFSMVFVTIGVVGASSVSRSVSRTPYPLTMSLSQSLTLHVWLCLFFFYFFSFFVCLFVFFFLFVCLCTSVHVFVMCRFFLSGPTRRRPRRSAGQLLVVAAVCRSAVLSHTVGDALVRVGRQTSRNTRHSTGAGQCASAAFGTATKICTPTSRRAPSISCHSNQSLLTLPSPVSYFLWYFQTLPNPVLFISCCMTDLLNPLNAFAAKPLVRTYQTSASFPDPLFSFFLFCFKMSCSSGVPDLVSHS
jgi:hypothetical protein